MSTRLSNAVRRLGEDNQITGFRYPSDERPLCDCHGEPMQWVKVIRRSSGGYWRCPAKHRENMRRWREANPEKYREQCRRWREASREKRRENDRRYWRRANGGYIQRRKRSLAQQRARVLEQLDQLAEVRRSVDQP